MWFPSTVRSWFSAVKASRGNACFCLATRTNSARARPRTLLAERKPRPRKERAELDGRPSISALAVSLAVSAAVLCLKILCASYRSVEPCGWWLRLGSTTVPVCSALLLAAFWLLFCQIMSGSSLAAHHMIPGGAGNKAETLLKHRPLERARLYIASGLNHRLKQTLLDGAWRLMRLDCNVLGL